MAPEAAGEDLLYLSDVAANDVKVYSFRKGRLVGTLTGFGEPRSECADEAGNVWIADIEGRDVIEYPHGGTKPIASLDTFGVPLGCSVDSAAIFSLWPAASAARSFRYIVKVRMEDGAIRHAIPIRRYASHTSAATIRTAISSSTGYESKAGRFTLVELRRRSKTFESIAVSQAIDTPGQVQWDGKDLAIGDSGLAPSVAYRFSISGRKATEVGRKTLDGTTSVRQFWIAGDTLVGPDFRGNAGFWRYPAGARLSNRSLACIATALR